MILEKYFKIVKDRVYVDTDEIRIRINKRIQDSGYASIGEHLETLAVFDVYIDKAKIATPYVQFARIHMEPSDVDTITTDDGDFIEATFKKGDLFMRTKIVQDPKLSYVIWYEFLFMGCMPVTMKYHDMFKIFDDAPSVCGIGLDMNHALFEIVYSHIARVPGKMNVLHRNGDHKEEPEIVPLKDVAHVTITTSARIIGPYFDAGVNAAIVNKSKESSDIEQLLTK